MRESREVALVVVSLTLVVEARVEAREVRT